MNSVSLVIEYLTGYAVATDPASRERAEWPPHPARVFMALASAHFETEPTSEVQREALEWLAALPPPDLVVPKHTSRDVLTVFVPVNDQNGSEALVKRSRQPRTFPRVHVGDEPLRLTWHFTSPDDAKHLDALESICRQVTRIGHSSSLVCVRLEREVSVVPTHKADDTGFGMKLRTPFDTMLRSLRDDYGQDGRDTFQRLHAEVQRLEMEKSQIKGKGASDRRKQIGAQISSKKAEIDTQFKKGALPPIRPNISHSTSYVPTIEKQDSEHASIFDSNFIVLKESDEASQTFGLESTAQITEAMIGLLLSTLRDRKEQIPLWVSGHEPNGDKLKSQPHMAIIPLAFLGREHADGHMMGVGLVIPTSVPLRERSRVLSPILFDARNEPRQLTLKLGRAGVWTIERNTSFSPKRNLTPLTYTAPSRSWASVTPVVLDRMAKADRTREPLTWREEVAAIIAQSCANVGLPHPIAVRVEKTPFFRGSLRAMPGQGGFPQLRAGRFQVHVAIEFDRPVAGPVLIGAGRFRGYGLMRPWQNEEGR